MKNTQNTNNRSDDEYFSTGTVSSELMIAGNVLYQVFSWKRAVSEKILYL
jgi:hypothetical protein